MNTISRLVAGVDRFLDRHHYPVVAGILAIGVGQWLGGNPQRIALLSPQATPQVGNPLVPLLLLAIVVVLFLRGRTSRD